MHVLITGGAGYVGSLLTEALLEAGYRVTIVDNFMFGYEPILHIASHPNLKVIKTDIRNKNCDYLASSTVPVP